MAGCMRPHTRLHQEIRHGEMTFSLLEDMRILSKNIRISVFVIAGIVAIASIVTVCEVHKARRMQEALELALEQNRSGIRER